MRSRIGNLRTATGALILSLTLLVGVGMPQARSAAGGTPVGVWETSISFRDCGTGDVIRVRPGIISFMTGGVMQEFGTGSAPGDRSDAQGVWRHTTEHNFTSVSKAFRFGADGTFLGSLKIYRTFELTDDGGGLSVDVRSEIYDTAGNLISRGCSTEAATRLN